MDPITAAAAATVAAEAAAPTAAMAAPSILAGTGSALTGAGMMTAGADLAAPSLLTATNAGLLGNLGAMGSAGLNWMKSNPMTTLSAGTKLYDYANQQPPPLQQAPNAGVSKGKGTVDYQPLLNIEIPKQKYPHSLLLG